ncbi:hypothetical protein PSI9734_00711 [Pseudidiomarina piscicola]|uniref:Thiamin/hydroxymethyl pyrimidine-binding YkoF putative domain-containing protein n=1 Tax=Pseudidiomarina piscicola TaxID=2614830 RepID=A0A6S6WQS9_9GAMM|nr:hypothetical protein [Pseudidiomarina piscicola]CAB0150144.1 hypothetical protein PSI9734_00711 [Pseudidiomarina piscicola]VZT39583.1 hypothetical protein PSI9734_00711 [Pseudomonas aeruginosa]
MKLTVDISKYPLADNYIEPIKGFIEQLNQYQELHVITNTLSTQVFGDYEQVMAAVQDCIKWSFERYGKVVFVCKFLHGDLRPEQ